MVRYLSIGLVLIIGMLAIISRKNYSKYKQEADYLWCLSYMLLKYTPTFIKIKAGGLIRKTSVLNTKGLDEAVEVYLTKIYHSFLTGMIIALLITFGITFIPEEQTDLYKVTRPDAGEGSSYVDIELYDDSVGDRETFSLEVSPREYTDEEFLKASGSAKKYIDSCILGDNPSSDQITKKLTFPSRDESGVLKITWSTSEPDVINSEGEILKKDIEKPIDVTLTAEIKDDNHSDTYTKDVVVIKNDDQTSSEKAKVSILNIERDERTEKELVIPRELNGVKILRESNKEKKNTAVLFLGIITVLLVVYKNIRELNEIGEKRDVELEEAYYSFVNRLAIHIGAGLSLRDAMKRAAEVEKSEYLKKEVGFALNKVASGVMENSAYMELGKNLGSQEYLRLMSLLSQNLAYGNSNLIGLLDSEVKQSFYIKRERIRKKGEQASEKLLLPTAILLILVIVIVMYPAFINL